MPGLATDVALIAFRIPK